MEPRLAFFYEELENANTEEEVIRVSQKHFNDLIKISNAACRRCIDRVECQMYNAYGCPVFMLKSKYEKRY